MKTILSWSVIMFICFVTFSQQQKIDQSELKTIKMNQSYLKNKESMEINKYAYLVFGQSGNDLKFTSLVLAMIRAESNFDHTAKSHMGAVGLMQLMPSTALDVAKDLGIKIQYSDLSDPNINTKLGISYIKYLQERLSQIEDDDRKLVLILASYNSGLHTVKRSFKCRGFDCYINRANLCDDDQFNESLRNLPDETKEYLKNVKVYYTRYKNVFNVV